MKMKVNAIKEIFQIARSEKRAVLLEPEGLKILELMGISCPKYCYIKTTDRNFKEIIDKAGFTGPKLVLKVVSPEILHKSDVGGVRIVENNNEVLAKQIEEMNSKFKKQALRGFLVAECVDFSSSFGGELLLGLRNTPDYGPIITFGPGGVMTEFFAKNMKEGHSVSILSAYLSDKDNINKAVNELAVSSLITNSFRGREALIPAQNVVDLLILFQDFAREFMPDEVKDFEVNPFVVSGGKLVALDVLIKLSNGEKREEKIEKPIHKIANLLKPRSAAIIGVSEKMNVGHIILNNFIKEGFSKDKLYLVKPGSDTIEGCKCFPSIQDLPEKVDLFVLCVPAASVPDTITETIKHEKAESIIVIPGGLEEKSGTSDLLRKMHATLNDARKTTWQGPVINGGNCLGIISRPGKYDNMFIPDYKKTYVPDYVSPVAFISQSGAFAVSRLNKLLGINPKYSITIGNQMDLTLGDYLSYLKDDKDIKVFSIYLEGFKPFDGHKFLKAAKEIISSGRTVIFYTAGKTPEGAKAMASHTASIAGDYLVSQELSKQAGVVLAENFEDFEDLTRLFVALEKYKVSGRKLAVVSNAGCECVAASDNLYNFKLAEFSSSTNKKLEGIFQKSRIDAIVDVHNPIDLTPMANDGAYDATIRAAMEDSGVDVGVLACIPLAPTLNALPKGAEHREDYLSDDSIVQRYIKIFEDVSKAMVAVVDAGELFDPMVRLFTEKGIPTFRTIDRALRLFDIYCGARLG